MSLSLFGCIPMFPLNIDMSSPSIELHASASPASSVACFEQFLRHWRETGAPTAVETAKGYELRTPPKASFRPHEIVSRVYLGGIRDVANVAELMRAVTKESERRAAMVSPAPVPPLRPHQVFLMVSVCQEITRAATDAVEGTDGVQSREGMPCSCPAQLELRRVLTPQEVNACAAAATTKTAKTAKTTSASSTQTKAKSHLPRSALVTCYPLAELEQRAVQEDGHTDSTRWWSAFLSHQYAEAMASRADPNVVSGASCRSPVLYWRLVLPLEDAPDVALRPFFRLVSTIARAALEASVVSAAPLGSTATPSTLPMPLPCVVFHCMAGRSRSATLVMAFLMAEWARSRACTAEDVAVGARARVAGPALDAAAQALVWLLLRFVQERRPIVQPNDGFYRSLEEEAAAVISAMCSSTTSLRDTAGVGGGAHCADGL